MEKDDVFKMSINKHTSVTINTSVNNESFHDMYGHFKQYNSLFKKRKEEHKLVKSVCVDH